MTVVGEERAGDAPTVRRRGPPIGHKRSAETRSRMSEARKAMCADPEIRQRMSAAMKRRWSDPAYRQRLSEKLTVSLSDPAVRKKLSDARKAVAADPPRARKHLRDLTDGQREAYRMYRKNGYSMAEALAAIRQQPAKL